MTRNEIEERIQQKEKQLYYAQTENKLKKDKKMGEILIDSIKKNIQELQAELDKK